MFIFCRKQITAKPSLCSIAVAGTASPGLPPKPATPGTLANALEVLKGKRPGVTKIKSLVLALARLPPSIYEVRGRDV